MALKTLGQRTFNARTFKPLTFTVFVLVRRKNYSGGGPDVSDETSKYRQDFNFDYELIELRKMQVREDDEILAVIIAAATIILE